MDLFHTLKLELDRILNDMMAAGDLPDHVKMNGVTLEPPKDPSHGDMATNAAMVLAGQAKCKPRDLAEKIAEKLQAIDVVESVEIAGPGFINLRLAGSAYYQVLSHILEVGVRFGDSAIGNGHRINVEYVSANPTGPLHIGHARGAVYGDALAQLLQKAGYDVTREYYINDAGAQVDVLARSVYLRYREACGETIEIPEGLYPGEYLKPVGAALKQAHGDALMNQDEAEWLSVVKPFAIDAMMDLIREDLKGLGIEQDVFTSEKSLHENGAIEKAIAKLDGMGLMYRGVLEPPKGKLPDDWEAREQLLFKSTEYGDDVDRALQKPDDSYTYFAADLAYAQDKIDRGFETLVYMLGADHGGYKKRMEAAIDALSERQVKSDIKLCQLVHLFKDGEPVKMSKRAGNFETVRDVVEAVGKDIIRFMMLTRKNDMVMEFDLDKVKEQSKDNPVFYVQYCHARAKSLLRLAVEQASDALAASENIGIDDLGLLNSDAELALIRLMASYPRQVEAAARSNEPHRIAYFLQELASHFHGFWNLGQGEQELRFILPDQPKLTAARLALARAVALVVASGLEILGVQPVEELR
ncbi:MAG: arginine--tRNA ligase [Rickettsiales bacterium]|nr:arginine--tRNA ligase [Rickettsiales bacterium]